MNSGKFGFLSIDILLILVVGNGHSQQISASTQKLSEVSYIVHTCKHAKVVLDSLDFSPRDQGRHSSYSEDGYF